VHASDQPSQWLLRSPCHLSENYCHSCTLVATVFSSEGHPALAVWQPNHGFAFPTRVASNPQRLIGDA